MEMSWGRSLVLATTVLALSGCGGGGSSSSDEDDSAGERQSPGGIWIGDIKNADGQIYEAAGLITEAGELRFVAIDEEQTVGTMTVSGSSFSANLTSYAPLGNVFDQNGETVINGSASGTIEARTRFDGTAKFGGETASTFSFFYDDIYE